MAYVDLLHGHITTFIKVYTPSTPATTTAHMWPDERSGQTGTRTANAPLPCILPLHLRGGLY